LYYTAVEPKDAVYMILTLDDKANSDVHSILEGRASAVIMGKKGIPSVSNLMFVIGLDWNARLSSDWRNWVFEAYAKLVKSSSTIARNNLSETESYD
jgi:hypothetical protein